MTSVMAEPAANFDEAISVTPLSSHTYSANLRLEWSIGTVPNGGYVTAVFHHVARTHMRHTHPKMHNGNPDPITLHLSFLRRTEAGPATFRVQDTKLGSRTSTLHIALSQKDSSGKTRDEVAAYITCSDMKTETGPSMPGQYQLSPPPVQGSNGPVDLARLGREGRDGPWEAYSIPYASMRRASKHIEFFISTSAEKVERGFVEQWVRFKPYGKVSPWTEPALGFLIDMFPSVLETFDERPWLKEQNKNKKNAGTADDGTGSALKFWYPTVLLNVDIKKKLPPQGVEWLYSRVNMISLKNGRMDLNIVVMDPEGDVVALSNHVALIVSAERNLSARGSNGNGNGKSAKI